MKQNFIWTFFPQVFNGEGGAALHPETGFTGSQRPDLVLSAEEGEMVIRFRTDSTQNGKGFSAVFSADCPPLTPGEGSYCCCNELHFVSDFFS